MVFEMNDNLLRESNITELKTTLNDKLEKEVVAFLNYREGGDIYFGVDDHGIPKQRLRVLRKYRDS